MSLRVAVGGLLALACFLIWLAPARALTPEEVERRVQDITDGLRCPTCQSVSVKDSEAAFSQEIREKVTRMVQEGQSDDAIKAYFVSRYGEWILRAPPAKGVGLVLWLLPGAAILIVGGAVGWHIWGRGRRAAVDQEGGAQTGLTPAQLERLQRDLRRFDEED